MDKNDNNIGCIQTNLHTNDSISAKKYWFFFVVAVILQCTLMVHFGLSKPNLHCDEFWSFAMANAPFTFILNLDPSLFGTKLSNDFWNTVLTARLDDIFNLKPVWEHMSHDVHPPLYFAMLHMFCALWDGTFSMLPAVAVNLVFFVGTQLVLAKTTYHLTASRTYALMAVIAYGFSLGAISTVLCFRMYMMQTMFIVGCVYYNMRLLDEQDHCQKAIFIKLAIVHVFGFLTQYYYAIYAFFSAVPVLFKYVVYKRYKAIAGYIASAITAVVLCAFIFPTWIKVILLGGHHEHDSFGNLIRNPLFERASVLLHNFISGCGILPVILFTFVLVLYFVASYFYNFNLSRDGNKFLLKYTLKRNSLEILKKYEFEISATFFKILTLLVTIIFSWLLIAKISLFFTEIRYIFPLLPLGIILFIYILFIIGTKVNKKVIFYGFACMLVAMLGLYSLHSHKIYWYWDNFLKMTRILQKYPDTTFIAVQKDHNAYPLVTQGYTIARCRNTYVFSEKELPKLAEIKDSLPSSVIVWVTYRVDDYKKTEAFVRKALGLNPKAPCIIDDYDGKSFHWVRKADNR